jgi:acetyl-CoA carboxylase alpha subunit
LRRNLERISALPIGELMEQRYDKFRKLGKFTEEIATAVTPAAETE